MNPNLALLNPYPFEKLRALLKGVAANDSLSPIDLTVGEPKHAVPSFVPGVLAKHYAELAHYPKTGGTPEFKNACVNWLKKRYDLTLEPQEILSCNGSKEALFSFIQAVLDPARKEGAAVVVPNPAYQIYEGATLLAGGEVIYADAAAPRFFPDWEAISKQDWEKTQIVVVCSPHNPTGAVASLKDWDGLFRLQKQYGFVIASDECYGEIYFKEKPLGMLEAAAQLGLDRRGKVMFTSLSKRSNLPGLRSGFVAGDEEILAQFLTYRTYDGGAMSELTQAVSIAAWEDEAHVKENRRLYAEKFAAVVPILQQKFAVDVPAAAFYLWLPVGDDLSFAKALYGEQNVKVLPGSFLARETRSGNPGAGRVRVALVDSLASCVDAAERLVRLSTLTNTK